MAARLGRVIYWTGCGMAVIAVLLAGIVFFSWRMPPPVEAIEWIIRYLAAAVVFWLVGRAARYVLAGE